MCWCKEAYNGYFLSPYTPHAQQPSQLIITLAFKYPVKLHSLQLTGPNDGKILELSSVGHNWFQWFYCIIGRAPKTVKLFINLPPCQTPSFDDAERMQPVQEFWWVWNHIWIFGMKGSFLYISVHGFKVCSVYTAGGYISHYLPQVDCMLIYSSGVSAKSTYITSVWSM